MDPYLGMIFAFAGNFAIKGFDMCSGQLLAISTNTALFSLLGTNYGGNGANTFALPDLRGRTPIHQNPGANYNVGQSVGAPTVTLSINNLPLHNHALLVSNTPGTTGVPAANTFFADGPVSGSGPNAVAAKSYTTAAPNIAIGSQSIGLAGANQPIPTLSPSLVVTYLIAINGIFPARN